MSISAHVDEMVGRMQKKRPWDIIDLDRDKNDIDIDN